MCSLLEEKVIFVFDESCLHLFEMLKKRLIQTPILINLNCELPFELMCDASDTMIGAVLGRHKKKMFHSIYYASKKLDVALSYYTGT